MTGGVVEYDPRRKTYRLPPEHAVSLTRAASPNNAAVAAQFIGVLGAVEDEVVAAFRHGRGVPYSAYPRFHEVMAEESHQPVVAGRCALRRLCARTGGEKRHEQQGDERTHARLFAA